MGTQKGCLAGLEVQRVSPRRLPGGGAVTGFGMSGIDPGSGKAWDETGERVQAHSRRESC